MMTNPTVLEPSPPSPRLFIGGLDPAMSTETIEQLLKRTGATPTCISRGSAGTFAHVSLPELTDTKIDNIIATLNNTMWRGAKLIIQRAKEHYTVRLRREWEETLQTESHPTCEKDEKEENDTETVSETDPFEHARSGKHKRFRDDIDISPKRIRSPLSLTSSAPSNDQPPKMELAKQVTKVKPITNQQPLPRPRALDSTLMLFGIGTTGPENKADTNLQSVVKKDSEDVKKSRNEPVSNKNLESYEEKGEEDNVSAERKTARRVLEKILKAKQITIPIETEFERRAALYRRLTKLVQNTVQHGKSNPTKVSVSTRHCSENGASGNCNDTVTMLSDSNTTRRAGLYRKLVSS